MSKLEEKIKEVNQILKDGEPNNIESDDSRGFIMTGYKPQYIVDAMNKVFGVGGWGFKKVSAKYNAGIEKPAAISEYKVWLKDGEDKISATAFGTDIVTRGRLGDSLKGAQTDAIKKALSYFSIGNRAYHGLLKGEQTEKKPTREKSERGDLPWLNEPLASKAIMDVTQGKVTIQGLLKNYKINKKTMEALKQAEGNSSDDFDHNAFARELDEEMEN